MTILLAFQRKTSIPCSHNLEGLEAAECEADFGLGRVEDSGADEVGEGAITGREFKADSGLDEAEVGAVTDKEVEALASLKVPPQTVP